jgi:hypothetical protein
VAVGSGVAVGVLDDVDASEGVGLAVDGTEVAVGREVPVAVGAAVPGKAVAVAALVSVGLSVLVAINGVIPLMAVHVAAILVAHASDVATGTTSSLTVQPETSTATTKPMANLAIPLFIGYLPCDYRL